MSRPRTTDRPRGRVLARAPQDTPGSRWTYLALLLVLAFSAFPIYWMAIIATGDESAVSKTPPQVLPGGRFGDNVREVFSAQDVFFSASLVNSVIVAVVATAAQLFFCSLAGFAFAKLRFAGRDALMIFVVLTLTIPNQLGIVALYILTGKLGINGTLLAVIAPILVSAFGVFYMRQFILGAVPDELIEAARMDGATTMRIYRSVVLPAIRPALAVLGLLTFVATWNDFQWPLIQLQGTDYPTSMVALSDLASGNYVIYRRVLSGALIATAPLLVVLVLGGRQIVRGIMEGAVKN
ncbi:carbohydrate ABC transporter permease [Planosporangium sp. 12N6]|uniref:carbohydrate ABC transporter permease n=1 Tax=Planosporangium spinosum TaxID=3402278 RepID=UPI003CF71780